MKPLLWLAVPLSTLPVFLSMPRQSQTATGLLIWIAAIVGVAIISRILTRVWQR
jgi:hypothetical protein